jgi:hypothetical protein
VTDEKICYPSVPRLSLLRYSSPQQLGSARQFSSFPKLWGLCAPPQCCHFRTKVIVRSTIFPSSVRSTIVRSEPGPRQSYFVTQETLRQQSLLSCILSLSFTRWFEFYLISAGTNNYHHCARKRYEARFHYPSDGDSDNIPVRCTVLQSTSSRLRSERK